MAKEFVTDVQRIPREIEPVNVFYLDEKETGDNQTKTVVRRQAPPEVAHKTQFDFFKDLTHDGSFEIWLQCLDEDQYFGVAQADLYLRAKDAPFYLNFIKGYFGLWMQMVLVVCIGIMFSTFFKWAGCRNCHDGFFGNGPVSIFFDRLEHRQYMGRRTGRIVHSNFDPAKRSYRHGRKFPDNRCKNGRRDIDVPAQCRSQHILPDLRQFGASNYVAYGFNIPGDWVAERGLTTLAFAVVLFLLGYFFMKTREVAKQ